MRQLLLFYFIIIHLNIGITQVSLRHFSQRLADLLPQEKIYMTFNKPHYFSGETIFFKAFAVMADNHQTDSLSGILYVDILDVKDRHLISQKILPILAGGVHGSIETDSFKNDILIVAYTRWMLNFSNEFHYNRVVPIKSIAEKMVQTPIENHNFNISFFPEGGNLVTEIASRIAIKTTDSYGQGIACEGIIVDELGALIETFVTSKEGFGHFILKPLPNKIYTAKVTFADGKELVVKLPIALEKGYTLLTDALSEQNKVNVFIHINMPDTQKTQSLFLIAHTRGLINYGTRLDIKDKSLKSLFIEIPKSKLNHDGIVHLTLFDEAGTPICERLFFNENRQHRLNITVKTNKKNYESHEKVILSIDTKNAHNEPVSADLSLKIIDIDKAFYNANSENILSYLLLRSDLGHSINNPFFFLKDTTFETRQHLDWLLMTHGWRRFTWHQVLSTHPPPQYFPESGLSIRGNVFDKKKTLKNKDILLTFTDNNTSDKQPILLKTDSMGNFAMDNLYFSDSTNCTLNVLNYKKNYNFKIQPNDFIPNRFLSEGYSEKAMLRLMNYLNEYTNEELANIKAQKTKFVVLDTFTIKDKHSIKQDKRTFQYSKPNSSIKIDLAATANNRNLVEFLNGREGLRMFMSSQGGVVIYPLRGNMSLANARGMTADNTPTIMIDGQPASPQYLAMIPFADVEKVDIIRSANALFGVRGANGVINILTKSGKGITGIKNNKDDENLPSTNLKGFSLVKEFYTPNYSESKPEDNGIDYRSSIFWEHSIKTDENGQANLSFHNPNGSKNVKIILEGLQKDGKIGFQILDYTISNK